MSAVKEESDIDVAQESDVDVSLNLIQLNHKVNECKV